MDETGARIIADASFAQRKRGVTQGDGADAGDADVNRVRLHVQAVLGYTWRTRAEKFIAPGGAIATDDIDLCTGAAYRFSEFGENVEKARIVVLYLARAMITQKMVELRLSFRKKFVAVTIDDVDVFASVRVIEAKVVFERSRSFGSGTGAVAGRSCKQATQRCECRNKEGGSQIEFSASS